MTEPPGIAPTRSATMHALRGLALAVAIGAPAAGTTAASIFFGDFTPVEGMAEVVTRVWIAHTLIALVLLLVLAGTRPAFGDPGQRPLARQAARALLASLAAVVAGTALDWSLAGEKDFKLIHVPYIWQQYLMIAGALVGVEEYLRRGEAAARRLHETALASMALDAELSAARLQLLQAQIEPHFLFNSLANLRRLQHTDVGAAREMLSALLRYLEEALPRLREPATTLGREAELVRAFLAVHQVRMGSRLAMQIEVPDALRAHPVPPMMLLTLVENAIKHGLQPLVEGGLVKVAAAERDGQLVLTVADTGRGMGSASGGGVGLANLRARLKALYGNAASLALRLNEPRGVVAIITLPMSRVAA
jgi:signal transduction histidine kinase